MPLTPSSTARYRGAKEVLLALSLGLILQTSSRFDFGIGLGELGLAVFVLISLIETTKYGIYSPNHYTWYLLGYLVFLLFPLTIFHLERGLPGVSMRDLLAYFLCAFTLVGLTAQRIAINLTIKYFILFLLSIALFHYWWGGESAYYSIRFAGGARNPNQLALYIMCALILITVYRPQNRVYFPVFVILGWIGLQTLSDGLMVSLIGVGITFLIVYIFPKSRSYLLLNIFILIILFSIPLIETLTSYINDIWYSADEGHARTYLYRHGIAAWLYDPLTIILGNGAGSFSGIRTSFDSSETHNTFIEMLTIGGIVGTAIFFIYPLKIIFQTYYHNRLFLFSLVIGLVAFSMFHFILRHPIFWFTLWAVEQKFLSTSNVQHMNTEKNSRNLYVWTRRSMVR